MTILALTPISNAIYSMLWEAVNKGCKSAQQEVQHREQWNDAVDTLLCDIPRTATLQSGSKQCALGVASKRVQRLVNIHRTSWHARSKPSHKQGERDLLMVESLAFFARKIAFFLYCRPCCFRHTPKRVAAAR